MRETWGALGLPECKGHQAAGQGGERAEHAEKESAFSSSTGSRHLGFLSRREMAWFALQVSHLLGADLEHLLGRAVCILRGPGKSWGKLGLCCVTVTISRLDSPWQPALSQSSSGRREADRVKSAKPCAPGAPSEASPCPTAITRRGRLPHPAVVRACRGGV